MSKHYGFSIDNTYLNLPSILYTVQKAVPVKDPEIILFNEDLAREMGLEVEQLLAAEGAQIFSGNVMLPESVSFAQAYSGHQFGYFNHLGDGRALMIGEHIKPDGIRVDVQLKGSGPTPYSRRGDGRAGLSPMLREHLISEAMAGLGVPTTRSLAVVSTGETVQRELVQEGAILTRMASSHIRVGTFQYAASRGEDVLSALYEYTVHRHYPECLDASDQTACFLNAVTSRQAKLIAKWQTLGFVHGVMNTDNVSIAGETIDYGPCAFLDVYNPDAVFSSIDTSGRYRYKHQPLIGKWNIARFAETLLPLFKSEGVQIANAALVHFDAVYASEWLRIMRLKLGLSLALPEDLKLVEDLLEIMAEEKRDFSQTFLELTLDDFEKESNLSSKTFSDWYQKWRIRLKRETLDREAQKQLMQAHNPAIIPRNHNVEHVLNAWVYHGDSKPYKALLELLRSPYHYSDRHLTQGAPRVDWPKVYRTTCGT